MSQKFNISRRKALAALGTVGVASAGAGFGTSAYFSDTESFNNNSLTAGELDLKVNWTEHYSDWSDDEASGVEVSMTDDSLEYGFPSSAGQGNKLLYVDDKDQFLQNTAIEAFPDIDPETDSETIEETYYDGQQYELPDDGDICGLDADLDEVLSSPYRTGGASEDGVTIGGPPNRQTTAPGDPLVNISDVKPGDFGEVTFGLHLCGNPGYVWITGELIDADENGTTEPEADDPEEKGPDESEPDDLFDNEGDESDDPNSTDPNKTTQERVELLDEIRASFWYDTGDNGYGDGDDGEGDNFHQAGEAYVPLNGSLRDVLSLLQDGMVPLDYSPGSGGSSSDDSMSGFDQCDSADDIVTDEPLVSTEDLDIGTSGGNSPPRNISCMELAEKLVDGGYVEKGTSYVGTKFEVDGADDFQIGTGSFLAGNGGTITIESFNVSEGTVTISTNFPVEAVSVKGGNRGENVYLFEDQGGTEDDGTDEQFGCTLNSIEFQTPDNTNKNRAGLSNVEICYDKDIPTSGGGMDTDSRECFPNSTTAYVGFEWWLPADVGNEVQGDSVSFDLGFYTEQCRHNENPGQAN